MVSGMEGDLVGTRVKGKDCSVAAVGGTFGAGRPVNSEAGSGKGGNLSRGGKRANSGLGWETTTARRL